ncbi:MAG: hypothetical protein V1724_00960 [Chloroflexota bacterium]
MQLTPRDLYRLRRSRLMAQRMTLRAQHAQQQMEELSLELERRYGLLARDAVLDMKTGVITVSATSPGNGQAQSSLPPGGAEEVPRGPADHADKSPS